MEELNACLKSSKPVRMEYVVLDADSVDTVKRTHGRYFGGEYEVVKPLEISYISSWREKLNWNSEEKTSAASWAFARALTNP